MGIIGIIQAVLDLLECLVWALHMLRLYGLDLSQKKLLGFRVPCKRHFFL